jgi:hypothetical protein
MPRLSKKQIRVKHVNRLIAYRSYARLLKLQFESPAEGIAQEEEDDPFSVEVMFDAYLFAVKHHLENNRYTFRPKTYQKYNNKQFEDDLETYDEAFLNDEEFLGKDRMSRESFELLVSKIEDHPVFKQKAIGRKQLPVSHQLMYLLKYLGTGGDGASNPNLRSVFKKGRGSAKLYKDRCVKVRE